MRYDYDATGRLTRRLHEGEEAADGTRPFIEERQYVWEGDRLAAEAAYAAPDATNLRWRRTYVPGPSGLDDPTQVVVEIAQPGSPYSGTTRTYTYLRDELGTVLGLVAEDEGTDPANPPIPIRYRYTPYGEAHAETGPELLRAHFDADATVVDTTAGPVTQTVADDTLAAPGALVLDWSLPLSDATLSTGLIVEHLVAGTGWTPVDPAQVAMGPESSEGVSSTGADGELLVLLTSGWQAGRSYRVRLEPTLTDTLGRPFGQTENLEWSIPPGDGTEPVPAVTFDQRFPVGYETWQAAGESFGGRFPAGQSRLFQGLWTDPVTGMGYARARWFDSRNGTFLTEDDMADVDSPNLYAFVAWGPAMRTDPLGLCFGGLRCRDLGTVWWEFQKANAKDVYEIGKGLGDFLTAGTISGAVEGVRTFSQTEGSLIERGEAAQAAMQRRQLAVITLGFSEADDKLQHASELVGIAGIQRGGAMMGEGIGMGDADLLWRGVAETSGGVGNFAGTLAAVGGTASAVNASRQAAARSAQQAAVRQRVLGNIAESQAARGASNFGQHVAREAQALRATTSGLAPTGAQAGVRFDPSRAGHIFREAAGHVNPASAGSRARFARLYEDVASNPANLRADAIEAGLITQQAADAGLQAFTWTGRSGQVWVTVRNGVIQNAGVNPVGAFR